MGVSLRAKVTASFVLLVLGGTTISTLLGSRIIAQELLAHERRRVGHGLEAAKLVYAQHLQRVRTAIVQAAEDPELRRTAASDLPSTSPALRALQTKSKLDFLVLGVGSSILGGSATAAPTSKQLAELLGSCRGREPVSGTVMLSTDDLRLLAPGLAARARIAGGQTTIASGLALVTAAPLGSGGRRATLLGGLLLNRNAELVDQIREVVFGGEQHEHRAVGAVSLFLGDARVATNVRRLSGGDPLGTEAAPDVAAAVLSRGDRWSGRAFVIEEWYATAYAPLRDPSDTIVGMLGVGMQESPYLAVRTRMMVTFLGVAVVGVLIVLGLTYLITRTMIRPLEEMAAATERIAAGNLNQRVHVLTRDEIGLLAAAFNEMVEALRTAREDREQWAHTLEEKVRERTAELVTVQTQMAQAEKLASLGRLAAGVAHEINNPLGGILTFSMLALEDCQPEHPIHRNLDIIVKQSVRCRDIVRGLLAFSHQSQSSPTLNSANAIVDATLRLLENQALFHNIHVVRHYQQDLPKVLVDPGELQQVIMNVVLNAVDAMEGNGVLTLTTSADPTCEQVAIDISDTGKGIPNHVLPLIFEPFYTTKEVGKGTGLGLAIAHGIITRLGGSISVSTSTAGTTMTMSLPFGVEDTASAAPPPASQQRPS